MKAGVSADAIRAALTGVGWQVADIEDSLKKVQGDMKPASPAMPAQTPAASSPAMSAGPAAGMGGAATMRPATMGVGATPTDIMSNPAAKTSPAMANFGAKPAATSMPGMAAKPAATTGSPIKMSDFMSGGAASAGAGTMASKLPSNFQAPASNSPAGKTSHHMGEHAGMIAEAIGLVALAALTIYFWTENNTLAAKLNAAAAAPAAGNTEQATSLQTQVQTLMASQSTLQAQVQTLTGQTTDLKTQLGFFASPVSQGSAVTGSVAGMLNSAVSVKGLYSIRTQYDAVIYVKNGGDPKVAALLKPLVGSSVTLSGTYIPGSDALTVTGVNGSSVNAPAVATSTATTTAPAATSSASAGPLAPPVATGTATSTK